MTPALSFLAAVMILLHCCHLTGTSGTWKNLNLPDEHVPFFFTNNPNVRMQCEQDKACPYKKHATSRKCWGYEENCAQKDRMFTPLCSEKEKPYWVKGSHVDKFWREADFGYVKDIKDTLTVVCQPEADDDSSLSCSEEMKHCRATNIYIELAHLDFGDPKTKMNRYRDDVVKLGDLGGHCKLSQAKIEAAKGNYFQLTSWYNELKHFTAVNYKPMKDKKCDVVIEKPTYIMKLDAGVNMYHHFCDFVNLYVSQHINNTFSTDVLIFKWETSQYEYADFFSETWKVFTDHPLLHMKNYVKKRICFKEAIFSALPRMDHGLFYNMPLVPGCTGASLMKAFADHVLHRLRIKQNGPHKSKIRVTLLNRGTRYRNILNRDKLVNALRKVEDYDVREVTYDDSLTFKEQLKISYNSDVFIGVHGAGLTHLLFLPDWAVIFEIFHCEDPDCYSELAAIRGVKYMTWERKSKITRQSQGVHPQHGPGNWPKFTNYSFDVKEFLRMIAKAAKYVRANKTFKDMHANKHSRRKEEL